MAGGPEAAADPSLDQESESLIDGFADPFLAGQWVEVCLRTALPRLRTGKGLPVWAIATPRCPNWCRFSTAAPPHKRRVGAWSGLPTDWGVDGALDELAQGELLTELALVLSQQGFEGQAQTAGAIRASGQRQFSFCMLYTINTYRYQDVVSKNEGGTKMICRREGGHPRGLARGDTRRLRKPCRQCLPAIPGGREARRASG